VPNPDFECFRPGPCPVPGTCLGAGRCLYHAPLQDDEPTPAPLRHGETPVANHVYPKATEVIKPTRPDRDDLFMQIAYLVSTRSTCLRGHVGAVVVKDRRIISMGYNGAPPGQPHCLDVGCDERNLYDGETGNLLLELGCQRAIHAEANALAWAARAGVSTDEATMYATHSPCPSCARLCVSAGICKYVYDRAYRVREGIDVLDRCNVEVIQHP
jgi:dCMP deaminase